MEQSKAAFRAIREECGMTQQDVAVELGYDPRSVKRWENEAATDYRAPEAAWAWLLACRDALYEEADHAVREVLRMHRGDAPVALTYYRTQEQLDARQLDAERDRPVGYVNAVTRECARQLRDKHVDVVYAYPADE